MNKDKKREEFGALLLALRRQRKMKLRELETASGVPNPTISMFEKGKKGCGQAIAVKLADGLGLRGNDRLEFLTVAEASIERVSQSFPSALADSLFYILRMSGIDEGKVVRIFREFVANKHRYDVVVELDNGERYAIEIKAEKLQ